MTQSKAAEAQLASFLAKYTAEIVALGESILEEMRRLYPTAIELVYDNYNALAIGFSPTERPSEAIFSIALYPKWISLFFLQAKGLPDPDKLLKGSGNVAKHIVLSSPDMLHYPPVRELMREAVERAKVPFDPKGNRLLIIRSVSAKQRPRRPIDKDVSRAPRRDVKTKKKASVRSR
jgi:hypothetical protein